MAAINIGVNYFLPTCMFPYIDALVYTNILVINNVIARLPNNHNFNVKVIGLKILKEYQSHCLLLLVTKTNRYIYIY